MRSTVGMIVLSALVLAACDGSRPAPPKTPIAVAQVEGETITFPSDSPQLATLRLVGAESERASFVRINGRLAWDDTRTSRINSPVAGRVLELRAVPGATVGRGDVLAVISSPDFGATQAEARKAESDLQLSSRSLARVRELHQAGVVPTKDLQNAEAEFSRARAERERTVARERLYGGSNRVDQQFRLVAPLGGTVVERHLQLGQEVRTEGGADALFVISDPTRLWVSLDVPEVLSQEVQVGEAVRVMVPALSGETFSARVEYVADFIDPQTRTVKARAAIDNSARRLKAEMFITADLEVPASPTLRVPASAVFLQGDRFLAFVEDGPGRFTRRSLRAEESSLGMMRVSSGLNPGDKVVADGALLLQQIMNQKATAPRKGDRRSMRDTTP